MLKKCYSDETPLCLVSVYFYLLTMETLLLIKKLKKKKNSGLCPLWFSQLKLCLIPSTAHIFLRGSHLRFMVERPTVPRQNVSRIVSPLWMHGQWQNRAPPERIRQDEKETISACRVSGQGKFWSPTLNSHTPTFSIWLRWKNESVNHKSYSHFVQLTMQKFKISDWSFNREPFRIPSKEHKFFFFSGRWSIWTSF